MRIKIVKKQGLLAFFFLITISQLRATTGITDAQARSIQVQSDGKIMVAGYVVLNGMQQIMIARYTPFGTIDTLYGANGYVVTPIGGFSGADAMILLSTDQPVVAGWGDPASISYFATARYNTNGTLDTGFNSTGIITQSIGTGAAAYGIAVDANGKYDVAGTSIIGGAPILTLVRYNTNGTIDTSFGTSGIATKRIFSATGANDLAIQSSNGRIVVVGFTVNSGVREFAVMRFTTAGALDTSFNSTGTLATAIGYDSCANAIAIQSDGKIIAAGVSNAGFALARYTTSGSLDSTFGSGGIVTTAIGYSSQINDIILQSNGKIIAVGYSDNMFALARYNTNGTLDSTFGTGGIVTTTIGTTAIANGVTLQSNGQILVCGQSNNGIIAVRYNANGSIDTSFGTNGIINFPNEFNGPDIFGLVDGNIASNANISYAKLNLGNGIRNSDITVNAAIADTKLATIGTPGKVLNTATTATPFNVSASLVARDTLGNFSATMISSDLTGNVLGSASENLLKAGDTMSGPLLITAGSCVAPALAFEGFTTTGLFGDEGSLALATRGIERVKVDENGAVTIHAPDLGQGLTIHGNELVLGDISNSENITFNTSSKLLNAVGTTQNAFTKIFVGSANTGLSGSVSIDLTNAGFANPPVICANSINGVFAGLVINSITDTSALVKSYPSLNIPFNYIAVGI